MKCFSGQCFLSSPISPGTSKKYLTLLYSEGIFFQKGKDSFGQWLNSGSRGYYKTNIRVASTSFHINLQTRLEHRLQKNRKRSSSKVPCQSSYVVPLSVPNLYQFQKGYHVVNAILTTCFKLIEHPSRKMYEGCLLSVIFLGGFH